MASPGAGAASAPPEPEVQRTHGGPDRGRHHEDDGQHHEGPRAHADDRAEVGYVPGGCELGERERVVDQLAVGRRPVGDRRPELDERHHQAEQEHQVGDAQQHERARRGDRGRGQLPLLRRQHPGGDAGDLPAKPELEQVGAAHQRENPEREQTHHPEEPPEPLAAPQRHQRVELADQREEQDRRHEGDARRVDAHPQNTPNSGASTCALAGVEEVACRSQNVCVFSYTLISWVSRNTSTTSATPSARPVNATPAWAARRGDSARKPTATPTSGQEDDRPGQVEDDRHVRGPARSSRRGRRCPTGARPAPPRPRRRRARRTAPRA